MELYQIRAFVAVAELGHLTRAADRLHVSQPALSGQIKALESRLDLKLFEREPSGMVLTAAGRQLLPKALAALAAADEFRHAATRLSGHVAGTLRVGTVIDPESIRLGRVLASALREHPDLELVVSHQVSGEALQAVREGRLDASYFFGDRPAEDIAALELRRIFYRVALPTSWPGEIAGDDWRSIAALPWVLTPQISSYHGLVTRMFAEHGLTLPERFVEADDESVITNLVVSGVGVSLLREEAAIELQRAGSVKIWNGTRVASTLWFIAQEARCNDPLIKATFDLVRDSWVADAANDHRVAIV